MIRFFFLALVACSCALTSNAPPLDVRYFSVDTREVPTLRSARLGAAPKLTLGRIGSSAFLRDRIAYRDESGALATYDQWRWTEYPEAYLRRSMTHALFDGGSFVETTGGGAPVLDVELVAFEEVRRAGTRGVRVEIAYRLHEDERVVASDVVRIERAADASGGMQAVASAMTGALAEASSRIAAAAAHSPANSQRNPF